MKTFLLMALLAGCDEQPETEPADDAAANATNASEAPPPSVIDAPSDVAAPPADARKTDSGLAYKVVKPGNGGDHPSPRSKVEVHYTGWTTDGKMFDSSVTRGQTASFGLNQVIAGWTEGLQLMTRGEKTLFWIPEELAYKGRPGKPAGMLVFEVELIDFENPPEPPPAPDDVAGPPADAQKTSTGLAYAVLSEGEGTENPISRSTVEVHYTGWTTDGKMFDSSISRGKTAKFPLDRVIAGWTEGLQLMNTGDKYRFWIPEELAYKGARGKPAGMLVFDVELISFKTPPPPPPVPDDVAAPPADAKKTDSGLAYRILQKGEGTEHPAETSRVKVHYTGWTTDGEMFDSSVVRDRPSSFGLNRVIAGWTEGVQLMSPGDTFRFWIPEELAYKGMPGKPPGMLVFDVELLEISK
ncbi:MAG: FKBP-type peptidyl-prolyl cis-trans isomerase [Myxococcota bacterium]